MSILSLMLPISKLKITGSKIVSVLVMITAILCLVIGGLSLSLNNLEAYPVPLLVILGLTLVILVGVYGISNKRVYWELLIFAFLVLASGIFLRMLPEYYMGLSINGVIHRSFISALLLLAFSVPSICFSLYFLGGNTPRASDIAHYPLFLFPALIGFAAYGLIVFKIVATGAPGLSWSILTSPFIYQSTTTEVWREGWPYFESTLVAQPGMRNHILGTFLLMGLTGAISLPIGIGTGIYIHQYAGRKMAGLINFSTNALRSVSGIILIITIINILRSLPNDSFLSHLFKGLGISLDGVFLTGRSSYLLVSLFISLLVIPLIAKATEEGVKSLPQDITEGSLSLGASKEHTIFRILLPWSLPNIVTALVLGCAEAAGALTVIFLISGTGEFGVSPLNETTSLAYLIFDCRFGKEMGDQVPTLMAGYQFTAALLLLVITMGLTIAAMVLKHRFSKRYKGA